MDAAEFADRFAQRLAAQAGEVGAVGVKSVAAYRTGLRLDPRRPSPAEVNAGSGALAGGRAGGRRLADGGPRPAAVHAVGSGRPGTADPVPHRLRRQRHPDERGRPDAAHRLAAPAPGARDAAALLALAPARLLPGLHLPATSTSTWARSCTTSGRGAASRCWPRRPRSRRSPACCTPRTPTAPPSCTCSGRSTTGWRWHALLRDRVDARRVGGRRRRTLRAPRLARQRRARLPAAGVMTAAVPSRPGGAARRLGGGAGRRARRSGRAATPPPRRARGLRRRGPYRGGRRRAPSMPAPGWSPPGPAGCCGSARRAPRSPSGASSTRSRWSRRRAAPYASVNGAMHACGHDVHLAAVAALARAARALETGGRTLPAGLVVVLQPREEVGPTGATDVVAEGVLRAHDVRCVDRRACPAAGAGRARLVRSRLRQRRGRRGRGRRHRAGRAQRLPASDPRPGSGAVPDRPVAAGRRPRRRRPAPARGGVDGPALRLGRTQRRPRRGEGGRHRADDAPARHGGAARPDRGARHRHRRRARLRGPLPGPPRRAVAAQRPGDRPCRRPLAHDTRGADVPLRVLRLRRFRHVRPGAADPHDVRGHRCRPRCRHPDAARRRVPAARRQRPRGGSGTPRRLARRRRDPPAEPRRGDGGPGWDPGASVGAPRLCGVADPATYRPRTGEIPSRRASTSSATPSGG